MNTPLSRRELLQLGALSLLGYACASSSTAPVEDYTTGRLTVTVHPPTLPRLAAGNHELGLGGARDGFVYVPDAADPLPLLLLFHGYGGQATQFTPYTALADEFGFVLLAVDSRAITWDTIQLGGFGEDVAFVDEALGYVIDRLPIDAARVAVGGFSDGASYALSIGLTNGDLFTRTIAFSPGFLATGTRRGKPPVFISHGTQDPVLQVTETRRIVSVLRSAGYAVEYVEFAGGHTVPAEISRQAFALI